MGKKFYAVKVGRKPGIYLTWKECSKQVNKYSGSLFKSFNTLEEAQNFIGKKLMLKVVWRIAIKNSLKYVLFVKDLISGGHNLAQLV
ncbi:RNase H1/viroplasmin domain-containing protein [Clostridioides sp. ZZV14-6045]|uniref:ribonuclease H1 domain-containing protein n=1 Tax=Clostridioides sp. ZZV14-6045 TaxID=2811489 RepID=UPI001D11FEA1|nr:RNase H1/viroplasmin domain-containing protein [Clostridioides sp. ZZV14-6045]